MNRYVAIVGSAGAARHAAATRFLERGYTVAEGLTGMVSADRVRSSGGLVVHLVEAGHQAIASHERVYGIDFAECDAIVLWRGADDISAAVDGILKRRCMP